MSVIVTGAAGFIGFFLSKAIMARGEEVIGLDDMNDYYDVKLKEARLAELAKDKRFSFHRMNIADREAVLSLAAGENGRGVTHIVNLAAQAGVLYSLENPYSYIEANVMGHVVMMELARRLPDLKHFVYASSSSVYGGNKKIPFSIDDPVERPVSLYAATKRTDELISWSYSNIYGMPCTGLRFFTVYGPWGRPDMAAWIFAKRIFAGEPIKVFNYGDMRRDFTYIDDIVSGILAAMERIPAKRGDDPPVALYNLGNAKTENIKDFIAALEGAIGKKAVCDFQPMPAGDVPVTSADISLSERELGYSPKTVMSDGIPKFIDWYREYHGIK